MIDFDKFGYFASLRIDDYPWLYYVLSQDQKFHKHWAIYMSYLYEITYDLGCKEATLPNLNCVYKYESICDEDDHTKRDKLRDLMDYGLIVWSRDNLNNLRSEFFQKHPNQYFFYSFVLEAYANVVELREARDARFKYELQYMTKFILDIAKKAVITSINTEHEEFCGTMVVIEKYRYDNFIKGEYESFVELSNLIIDIGNLNHNTLLIMDYLAESPVNGAYINQTIRIFRRHNPKMKHMNLIGLLRNIIIQRAQTWTSKARTEIEKLTQDPLFHKDAFTMLLNSTDQDFAAEMIQILSQIRNDWSNDNVSK